MCRHEVSLIGTELVVPSIRAKRPSRTAVLQLERIVYDRGRMGVIAKNLLHIVRSLHEVLHDVLHKW